MATNRVDPGGGDIVSCYPSQSEQSFHPPTGDIRWPPVFLSTWSLCQVTCNYWKGATSVNNTILPFDRQKRQKWNFLSLDWESALNSSTVLGELSDRLSPGTSIDCFFRESIMWGKRLTDRKKVWKWIICKYACTPDKHTHILQVRTTLESIKNP